MRIFLLVTGILLGMFGLVICLGTAIDISEGASEYSLFVNLLGLCAFGLIPLGSGAFMVYRGVMHTH